GLGVIVIRSRCAAAVVGIAVTCVAGAVHDRTEGPRAETPRDGGRVPATSPIAALAAAPVSAPAAIPIASVVSLIISVCPSVEVSAAFGAVPVAVPIAMLPVVVVGAIGSDSDVVRDVGVVDGGVANATDVRSITDIGIVADSTTISAPAE